MSKALEIKKALPQARKMFEELFPDENSRKRFTQESYFMITRVNENKSLAACDPNTVRDTLVNAVSMGLSLNPSLGEAFPVPYGKECKLIVGYQGLATLAYRSNLVESITCGVVHEGDDFAFELGSDPYIRHKISPDADEDSKDYKYVWAVIHMRGGGKVFSVKNKIWVEKRKAVSKAAKSSFSPWNGWECEMAKKTLLRHTLKGIPKSPEMAEAIFYSDHGHKPEPQEATVQEMPSDTVIIEPDPESGTTKTKDPELDLK